jgi:hypothetical protein
MKHAGALLFAALLFASTPSGVAGELASNQGRGSLK